LLAQGDACDGNRLTFVYQRLQEIDAHTAVARAAAILNGLGFTQEMQQRPTKEVNPLVRVVYFYPFSFFPVLWWLAYARVSGARAVYSA